MTIIVVNKQAAHPGHGWYIGRPSALGNPFKIGQAGMTREQVIACYDAWLRIELKLGHTRAAREFERLEAFAQHNDVALICWCAPAPCHGDVIKRLLEERLRRLPA